MCCAQVERLELEWRVRAELQRLARQKREEAEAREETAADQVSGQAGDGEERHVGWKAPDLLDSFVLLTSKYTHAGARTLGSNPGPLTSTILALL